MERVLIGIFNSSVDFITLSSSFLTHFPHVLDKYCSLLSDMLLYIESSRDIFVLQKTGKFS